MKRRNLKEIAGILIIILSLASLILWETYGRERINTVEIYVPSHYIEPFSYICKNDLVLHKIDRSAYIEGCITPENISQLEGKEAVIQLHEGQMLFGSMFREPENNNDDTTFLIPEEWIYSRTSSLIPDDEVVLYLIPENITLGIFRIDKLTDSNEQDCSLYGTAISNVEIQCSPEDYLRINSYAALYGNGFLLIYKEDRYGENNQSPRS